MQDDFQRHPSGYDDSPFDDNDDIIDRMRKRKWKSWVNYILVAANILVFLYVEATGGSMDTEHMIACGAAFEPLIKSGQYYRLFTSMFLHFGIAHLANNMILLFFLGDYMERFLGHAGYLVLYIAGGLFANWFSYRHAIAAGENSVSAGASGAIFALIGGLVVLVLASRGRLEDLTWPRVILMAVLSVMAGFQQSGIDVYAHIGGLLSGMAVTLLLLPVYFRRRKSGAGRQ